MWVRTTVTTTYDMPPGRRLHLFEGRELDLDDTTAQILIDAGRVVAIDGDITAANLNGDITEGEAEDGAR